MTPASPFTSITREVTATREEFLRGLHAAFPLGLRSGPGGFCAEYARVTVRIDLTEGAPRRLGALSLPTLHVTIEMKGGAPEAHADLLARMDRAMHRGGG